MCGKIRYHSTDNFNHSWHSGFNGFCAYNYNFTLSTRTYSIKLYTACNGVSSPYEMELLLLCSLKSKSCKTRYKTLPNFYLNDEYWYLENKDLILTQNVCTGHTRKYLKCVIWKIMNKTIIASLAILVLVVGTGSHFFVHSAEAKGMPQHWLNSDGTVKKQFLQVQKGTSTDRKYPLVSGWTKLNN